MGRFEYTLLVGSQHANALQPIRRWIIMNALKRFAVGLLAASVLANPALSFATPAIAHETPSIQGSVMGRGDIQSKINEICRKYDLYEPMSPEDAEFIKTYANPLNAKTSRGSKAFNWSNSGGGTRVTANGNVYHNGSFNYTWGMNMTVRTVNGATPQKMVASVTCTSFGPFGSGGYGKIYERTLRKVVNNTRTFTYSPAASYSGVGVAYTVNAQVDVTVNGNHSFTVTGD